MKNITTGVDKLLKILEAKKKTTLGSVALEMNLDEDIIQEWLELLEKEGLISLSNKLGKTWIEPRTPDKKDAVKSAGEIISEKEAFSRKIDVAIKNLERDSTGFEDIKREFSNIQSHIKNELDTVKKDMNELKEYDKLKQNITKEIEQQKKDYQKFSEEFEKQLEDFNRQELEMLKKLKTEEEKAMKKEETINSLETKRKQSEETIKKEVQNMKEINKETEKQLKEINVIKNNISSIRKDLEKFNLTIKKNKEQKLKKLAEKIQINKEKIEEEHNTLLKKAKTTLEELKAYDETEKKMQKKFETLFGKRLKVKQLIDEIDKERNELRKEMEKMKDRVDAFSAIKKKPGIKKDMQDIEKEIKKQEQKRNTLSQKIGKLIQLINN